MITWKCGCLALPEVVPDNKRQAKMKSDSLHQPFIAIYKLLYFGS